MSRLQHADVVVVGAGFAGLYLVHRLREAGFNVVGLERGADVGGTWYWNRYPGARCDIPSLLYSFTFSDDLHRDWRWSEKYATQPELLAYAEHVTERFGLRDSFRFNTSVTAAHWDQDADQWTVTTDQGDAYRARWCVMATGCLSVSRGADIAGAERFMGESYVTGNWPHDGVDFSGKRVAIIGTGSSAIQSIPLIAEQAAHLTVLQRTPNYSMPAMNGPIADEEKAAFDENFETYRAALRAGEPGIELPPKDWQPTDEELQPLVEGLWNGWGLISAAMIPNLTRDAAINEKASAFVRSKIGEIVKDPETARRLTPTSFPIATKRACVDTGYYATFNRDNVTLVDLRETTLESVEENGVRTSDGLIEVDAIVYALGFDAMTGALSRIDIRGEDGRALKDEWSAGPRTYLGLAVAGFPNMFTVTGPGSPSVLSNMLNSIEYHVDWIADAITAARDEGVSRVAATEQAQADWVDHVNEEANATLFPTAASWYMGANVPGKPRVFMPYVGEEYKKRIDRVAADGYTGFERRKEAVAA